jgi:putative peptidoglycan lipid II flippase
LIIAAAIMALALSYAIKWAEPYLVAQAPVHVQAAGVFGLIFMSMVIYFALAFGSGGASLGMIRRNVKRRAKAAEPPAENPS